MSISLLYWLVLIIDHHCITLHSLSSNFLEITIVQPHACMWVQLKFDQSSSAWWIWKIHPLFVIGVYVYRCDIWVTSVIGIYAWLFFAISNCTTSKYVFHLESYYRLILYKDIVIYICIYTTMTAIMVWYIFYIKFIYMSKAYVVHGGWWLGNSNGCSCWSYFFVLHDDYIIKCNSSKTYIVASCSMVQEGVLN